MADKCAFARAKLAQFTSSLKDSNFAEKSGTLVKVGYLGSLKTTERNVIGNLSFGGMEYAVTRPTAVALDYIQAVARSAVKFGKIKPHEYRTIANTANRGGWAAGRKGIREGITQAVDLIRTGVDAAPTGPGGKSPDALQEELFKFEHGETTFKNPVVDKTVKFVFNSLEAQDKPFYRFAFETSLYGRARLMGIREGLTGAKLSSRINELLAKPTEEMHLGAHADAQYATFKNKTVLSGMANDLRTGARRRLRKADTNVGKVGWTVANLGMDITIPFTKVASAITMAGVDYSPAGVLKAFAQAMSKNPEERRQVMQQLARATLGTGMTMAGYAMYANGNITGSAPTNPSMRKLWDAEGKQANSVLIGGRWRSITFLGPLAIPLLVGAGFRRFTEEGEGDKGAGEIAAFGVGTLGKTMTEQSYMQGVSNLIGAMSDTDGRAASAIAGLVPIPSISGQLATAIDPMAREAHSPREKIQARIPFASKRLPVKVDPFGEEVRKTPGGLQGAAESLLDITNPRTDKSTALTQELERLQQGVSGVGPSFTAGGKKVQRSPETIRELTKEIGPELRNNLSELIVSDKYQSAGDDDKRKLIQKTMASTKRPVYKRERTDQIEAARSIKAALADIRRAGIQ